MPRPPPHPVLPRAGQPRPWRGAARNAFVGSDGHGPITTLDRAQSENFSLEVDRTNGSRTDGGADRIEYGGVHRAVDAQQHHRVGAVLGLADLRGVDVDAGLAE